MSLTVPSSEEIRTSCQPPYESKSNFYNINNKNAPVADVRMQNDKLNKGVHCL